jgi:uracil-DNA glycosylase family 4
MNWKPKTFAELDKIKKPQWCDGCILCSSLAPKEPRGASFSQTIGSGRNGVLILTDALSEADALVGVPAQSTDGYMLKQVLHRGGLKREDFMVASLIRCHPTTLEFKDLEPAITHCSHYLRELLDANPKIKVIVPVGRLALRFLLGVNEPKNWHGTINWNNDFGVWVVPSMVLSEVFKKGGVELPTVLLDIRKALDVVKNGYHPQAVDYKLYPTPYEFRDWVIDYFKAWVIDPDGVWLSADIETPYSKDIDEEGREDEDSSYNILCISFAYTEHSAITVPWRPDYIPFIQQALGSGGVKLFWNGNKFDVPRLKYNSIELGGLIVDGMDMWHFLYSDLPCGLGYVAPYFCSGYGAWKNLAVSQPEFYSCEDANRALIIGKGVKRELVKDGSWEVFLRDFVAIEPVFADCHNVGIGIDEAKRSELRLFYETLRDDSNKLIQDAIPLTALPLAKKDGYKGKPKDVRLLIKEKGVSEDEAWISCGYELLPVRNGHSDSPSEETVRWNKRLPFNPNSGDQIIAYITDTYGAGEVPKHKKTGKPTASSEELERVARRRKDRVLELIVDSSDASGKLSNFINNWPVGADGRVHTTITNNTGTFRMASKTPNCQNFPSRGAEAKMMRAMIVAGDGWEWLVEGDYKALESILVGWYANDLNYIRLSKLGVHDFLSSYFLAEQGLFERIPADLGDKDMAIALKACKKVATTTTIKGSCENYREAAKRTVHGTSYCMGPNLMHRNYPEIFLSAKAAEMMQDMFYALFPKIKAWQEMVVNSAYRACGVTSAFNYKRRFYNVKKWAFNPRLGEWELKWSEDAKKAVATLPQGSGAAIIRRALLSPAIARLRQQKAVMMPIHDSILARAKDAKHRDKVIEELIEGMEFAIPEMGGLVIPVEVKVSNKGWGEMEEVSRAY